VEFGIDEKKQFQSGEMANSRKGIYKQLRAQIAALETQSRWHHAPPRPPALAIWDIQQKFGLYTKKLLLYKGDHITSVDKKSFEKEGIPRIAKLQC